jgi:formate dehydrogenase subunit gamma
MSTHSPERLVNRYSASERLNHWVTAISFILLAFSGLALFHPSMFWFTQFFGGPVWKIGRASCRERVS